jgi:hypothetical protein
MLLAIAKLRKFIGKFTADYKYRQKTSVNVNGLWGAEKEQRVKLFSERKKNLIFQ